nr:immunoglobulin heavy chain junction region [Macaca mulatta]MOX62988.1 immunoglobulin heavy chain junction region [Macaca mulatta]
CATRAPRWFYDSDHKW